MELEDQCQHFDKVERFFEGFPVIDFGVGYFGAIDVVFLDVLFDVFEKLAEVEVNLVGCYPLKQIVQIVSPSLGENIVNYFQCTSKFFIRCDLLSNYCFKLFLLIFFQTGKIFFNG